MASRGVPLDAAEPAAAGLARLLAAELDVVVAARPGIVADEDIEHLHDWRVAIRRSRSLLRAAGSVLEADERRGLAVELRSLIRSTGELRDLDVWGRDLDELAAAAGVDPEPLRGLLTRDRTRARAAVLAMLDGQGASAVSRWRRLVDVAPTPPWDARAELGPLAARALGRAHRRARCRAAAVTAGGTAAEVHALRKRAKDLRYLVESFAPLAPEPVVASVAEPLRDVQDVLGDYQDDEVRLTDLVRFADEAAALGPAGREAAAVVGALAAWLAERHASARPGVTAAAATVAAPELTGDLDVLRAACTHPRTFW